MKTTLIIIIIILSLFILTKSAGYENDVDDLGVPYRNDAQKFNQY